MISFKNFYVITEGGNAVADVGKIDQKDIPETIANLDKQIFSKLGLNKSEWTLLGSALKKKDPSGDLDIGVDINGLARFFNSPVKEQIQEELFNWFVKKLHYVNGKDISWMKGIGVMSISFPIAGKKNKKVQVDLLTTDDLNFTKFAYHVPDTLEQFYFGKPGLYRDILMMAIAKQASWKVIKKLPDGSPEMIKYINYSLDNGLKEVIYSFKSPKTGKVTKNRTKISEIFKTKDVNEVLEFLLGKGATEQDANSFEDLWKRVESPKFPYKIRIKEIAKEFADKLDTNINVRPEHRASPLPMPEEIKRWL